MYDSQSIQITIKYHSLLQELKTKHVARKSKEQEYKARKG